MLSFSSYLHQEEFVLQLAEELFREEELLEADNSLDILPNSGKVKYKKDNGQFVACAIHTKDYGDREWYSSYSDPKFIEFSEKVLSALKNWNNLPTSSLVGSMTKPKDKKDETKLGVCDSTQTYGWKIAVKPSFNVNKTLDSCYVITCFNRNASSMSKEDNIFTVYQGGTKTIKDYVVNVDKVYVYKGKDELELKQDIEQINKVVEELEKQISDLKYELEYVEMEYEENNDTKFKTKIDSIKKQMKPLTDRLAQQINTKANIEKSLTENFKVYTITNGDREAQIIVI